MKNVKIDGIIVTKSTNFANSCPPHARSRYLPPNQTTADEMTSETMLFSMSALVRNVQGYIIDLDGIRTRYGIAHCDAVKYVEGDVADCSFAGVAEDQARKRRTALMADSARRVSSRARVRGGRLIRGGILDVTFRLLSQSCSPWVKLEICPWDLEPDQGAMRRLVGGRGDPFRASRGDQSTNLTLVGAPASFTSC